MATKTRRLADLLANIDDNSKVTSAGLLDATITAADLANDSVGTAEIIDDAVTAAAIADDAVGADALASNAVVSASIVDANITAAKLSSTALASVEHVKPHIQPGVLQPAVAGKLLDGTTSHSGAYGTAQADGKSYYYTDIKGSQPIKDPRIGVHFGGQRHKVKSIQLLAQETAAHGRNVYSIDGREWMRAVGNYNTFNDSHGQGINSGNQQNFIEMVGYFSDINMLGVNHTITAILQGSVMYIDGSALYSGAEQNPFAGGAATPLGGRFVDRAALASIVTGQTLGIHTFKFLDHSAADVSYVFGFELIAHGLFTDATCDTNHTSGLGSPASTSKITMDSTSKVVAGMSVTGTGIAAGTTVASIESATVVVLSAATTATNANQTLTFGVADLSIPAQNVVSYGKKFSISEQAKHYDPFNGFVNSTSLHSAFVDTATSLGLDHAPGSSAKWAISNSNNIRPYNGGRVVKWIASDGTIKTSVNMMPPNAQNIKTQASAEITTPSATNTTTTPNFSDDAIDQTLAESAKRFHYREFGNGSANQGTGGAEKADFSLNYASAADDNVYCMDDGLTQMFGEDVRDYGNYDILPYAAGDFLQLIFIGTGISFRNTQASAIEYTPAQNLPYGTHIIKLGRTSNGSGYPTMIIDGITMADVAVGTYGSFGEVTFHQPKMPPIPENAVVIADYMLMADFVKQANPSGNNMDHCNYISKGVRAVSATRDLHYNDSHGGFVFGMDTGNQTGWYIASNSTGSGAENNKYSLPAFGTNFVSQGHSSNSYNDMFVDDTDVANSGTTGNGHADIAYLDAAVTLGVHKFALHGKANQSYAPYISGKGYMIATPTHTSSHYQTFETPYLHELVGGDRNMEQTNLIVTPDGKSWDEVTRDTSYLQSNICINASVERNGTNWTGTGSTLFDTFRGMLRSSSVGKQDEGYQKDFAIAYDRFICLVPGTFRIHVNWYCHNADVVAWRINKNADNEGNGHYMRAAGQGDITMEWERIETMIRGDYIHLYKGGSGQLDVYGRNRISITRIG